MKLPFRCELKRQQCRSEASDRALLALTTQNDDNFESESERHETRATQPAQPWTEHAKVTSP